MTKDTHFSTLMAKPDAAQQAEIWDQVMELARIFEDEQGYSRQTVLEGLLEVTLDLAMKRADQRLFQHMNDTRRFYLYASELTKRRYDQCPNYKTQREAERRYGKDMLYLRDARNFGWEAETTEQN